MWPFKRHHESKTTTISVDFRPWSFLGPEDAKALGGLPSEAIFGYFPGKEGHSVTDFVQNKAFVGFLHSVVESTGPAPDMHSKAATDGGDGWIYIIDLRTPEGPQGAVPNEDIVGGFEFKAGKLTGVYWRCPQYLAFTANGPIRLPSYYHLALMHALRSLPPIK